MNGSAWHWPPKPSDVRLKSRARATTPGQVVAGDPAVRQWVMELPYATHFRRVSSLLSQCAPSGNAMWRRETGMAGDSQISTDFSPAGKPSKRTSVAPAAYEAVATICPPTHRSKQPSSASGSQPTTNSSASVAKRTRTPEGISARPARPLSPGEYRSKSPWGMRQGLTQPGPSFSEIAPLHVRRGSVAGMTGIKNPFWLSRCAAAPRFRRRLPPAAGCRYKGVRARPVAPQSVR